LTDSAYAQPITTASGEFRRPARSRRRKWFRRGVLGLIALVPLSILAVMIAVYVEARTAAPQQADAIVVMGAAQYNGNPTTVFAARLDTAYQLWSDGYAPLIVLTGGKMPGDAFTEAETGMQYLLDRGVPASALMAENAGRDTWQSMQGVETVLADRDVDSLLIVTDGFHLLRSELMARSLGFEASGVASEDSPIQPWSGLEFGYIVRETGGIFAIVPEMVGIG
jgi:uncharacterized SAM-binding protein YcdF (DUF218 family)